MFVFMGVRETLGELVAGSRLSSDQAESLFEDMLGGLLDDQAVYHRTLRVLANRAGNQTEFSSLVRGAYPGFLLEEVLSAGRERLASGPS